MIMGHIQIFNLGFSGTRFACSRSFAGGYSLRAGDHTLSLMPDVADALAQGGQFIRLRAQVAARSGREMKSCRTFARDLQAVDGRRMHLEIGISDAGDVYLEIDAARLTLDGQQASLLLAVLDQLGRDVTTINRATERPGPDFGVAQGLRGFAYPWEDDPEW
jgi:hypothetical protein